MRDIDRRQALLGLSAIAMAAVGPSRAQAQTPARCVLTPQAGDGQFYLDEKLQRSDIISGQPGAPLLLALQVIRASDCTPLTNARVDVWHADAFGLYSGVAQQSGVGGVPTASAAGLKYFRGTQTTDSNGSVRFRTMFPSWYVGRTAHVNFKVFTGANQVSSSQILFPDEVTKEVFAQWAPYKDHVSKRTIFNDDDPVKGGVLASVTRQTGAYTARATLVVTPR